MIWGLGGIGLLLGQALYRLTPLALEPLRSGMTPLEWTLFVVWCAVNAYAEGHRGFHLRFAPRVVARAFHLAANPKLLHVLFAPAYCMSLFHATRRGRITAWVVLLGIIALVLGVRQLAQPWRGIIDAGVVIGLGWGTVSIALHLTRALRNGALAPTDLPST